MNSVRSTPQLLLHNDIREFSIAEMQLREKLPYWLQTATSLKLKAILENYIEVVGSYLEKTENFFPGKKVSTSSLRNPVMEAMIRETDESLMHFADASEKDACLKTCIGIINHFKISAYGTAAAIAKVLNMERVASLLQETEINEKQIDAQLSQLDEHEIIQWTGASVAY